MKTNQELIGQQFNSYLDFQHIGACIFTTDDFFKTSPLVFAFNFLLNWDQKFFENFQSEYDQSLYISNLYNRNFPVLFSKKIITKINIQKELENNAQLISGLCTQNKEISVKISTPKLLIIIEQEIETQVEKIIGNFEIKLNHPLFENSKPLHCDIYSWNKK